MFKEKHSRQRVDLERECVWDTNRERERESEKKPKLERKNGEEGSEAGSKPIRICDNKLQIKSKRRHPIIGLLIAKTYFNVVANNFWDFQSIYHIFL